MPNGTIILPFEAPGAAAGAITVPLGFEAVCTINEAVGDPVRIVSAGTVENPGTNVYSDLIVGIINSKPTSTTCVVIIMGLLESITTGLTTGKVVWIGTSGELTTTKPVTGHAQKLGLAISPTDVVTNITYEKVIQ